MFIEITRVNHSKEEVKLLVNTDNVLFATERHQEPTNLYDENGNLVETKLPTDKKYVVKFRNGETFHLDQANYDLLVKALVK